MKRIKIVMLIIVIAIVVFYGVTSYDLRRNYTHQEASKYVFSKDIDAISFIINEIEDIQNFNGKGLNAGSVSLYDNCKGDKDDVVNVICLTELLKSVEYLNESHNVMIDKSLNCKLYYIKNHYDYKNGTENSDITTLFIVYDVINNIIYVPKAYRRNEPYKVPKDYIAYEGNDKTLALIEEVLNLR